MSAIKVPTSQCEEFKKYLQTTGIQEKLVHMLVTLYEEPEKPSDPLAFLRGLFESANTDTADIETLKQENADLKVKLGEAEERVKELEQKVKDAQPAVAEEPEQPVEEKAEE